MHRPRVYTITPSARFLPTLMHALIDGTLIPGFAPDRDPIALSTATIYLPTRRACRLAREVFLDVIKADAAVLPRIAAIGDIDEDEIALAEASNAAIANDTLDLPPELGGLERRMLLARLVLKWAEQLAPGDRSETPLVVHGPAAALALADDLARLIDDMTTREVPWDRLDGLVPDHVDAYWQLTLAFLKIAREQWPKILAERGALEPAARRDRLILAEAARLASAHDGPVVAAGSTGSMPATAKFLAAIARLPHGAIVLPGLDHHLDAESWKLVGEDGDAADGNESGHAAIGHPQFAMHALLKRLDLDRRDVITLGACPAGGREALVSETLRPARATDRWPERLKDSVFVESVDQGVSGLTVIEAANAEEEALAIAVALRETIETPNKTAALVTPDRALGRRVAAALGRWNVTVDDSGGDPLAETRAGIFARLAAEAALQRCAPVALLALLKHPLFRLGEPQGGQQRATATLESAVLRGPRPRPGSAGLLLALTHFRAELAKLKAGDRSELHPLDPRTRLSDANVAAAEDLVRALARALAPFEQLDPTRTISFRKMAESHHAMIAELSRDDAGQNIAFAGADGRGLASALEDVADQPEYADLAVRPQDYLELLLVAIGDRVVRLRVGDDSRVCIYGPLEARLTHFDRVVLGGLVEGTWPPDARTDPWLSRPMRHQLGLDLPERRIGLSAHDFAQMLGAPEVVLTRAAKLAGAPTVASRFLQRLRAVLGDVRWRGLISGGDRYLALARGLDRPLQHAPIRRPEPRPPRAARPTALSVTEIEHWLRDPYTIYAKHILKLTRLDMVDTPPGAADRGNAIHGAISEFTHSFAAGLPADPLAALLRIGRTHFAPLDDYPEARAFWWPRFERIARWLITWEAERRPSLASIQAELRGEIEIPLSDRSLRLFTRADRIERRADARYAILDFKTGEIPTDKQVRIGIAPQLTLEAAILRRGGFRGIPAASVAELLYVGLKGGDPAGRAEPIDFKDETADEAADQALLRLQKLAIRFEDEATAYRPLVLPMWKNRYGTYDDLARVKEWSETGGSVEPEE
jgi:ATP-dependent helicase/nuclease subunit B